MKTEYGAGQKVLEVVAVREITVHNWTGFGEVRSYGSTAFRAGYLGSKHSTTELRPLSLIDDKSRHFPCQRGPGLVLCCRRY